MADQVQVNGGTPKPKSWGSSVIENLKSSAATYIVTALLGLLAIFSDHLAENIKFALGRASLRIGFYNSLSTDLSSFIFDTEQLQEYIAKGLTTKDALTPVGNEYNSAVTNLRREQYAYRANIGRYWSKSRETDFDGVMGSVKAIDKTLHSLNDELGEIQAGKRTQLDPTRANDAALKLDGQLQELRTKVGDLLDKME